MEEASGQVSEVIEAALACGLQIVAVMPNSDAGSDAVRDVLAQASHKGDLVLKKHLNRSEFVAWMAAVDVMLGNSSSGIIEAASFGTPVVNVGSRQNLRERNANVLDVLVHPLNLRSALKASLKNGFYPRRNLYGDGQAGRRIVELLASTDWKSICLAKCNAY
jgi:GDP/UDP-N,N'-diacetylbacillosamine 2-epimerase (hydrolysing)